MRLTTSDGAIWPVVVCRYTCHAHCRQLVTISCPVMLTVDRGRRPSRVQTETSLTAYSALWMVRWNRSLMSIITSHAVL